VTTAGQLIDRVNSELLAGTVEERNKLAASTDASQTDIEMTYSLGSLRENTVFQIGTELFYVWEVNTTSKTATVERGHGGTTAATHTLGDIVTVNPRFPRQSVLNNLNAELTDLSSPMNGLFQMKTVDVTYNGSDRMVNLTGVTDIIDLYDVRYRYLNDDYPIVRLSGPVRCVSCTKRRTRRSPPNLTRFPVLVARQAWTTCCRWGRRSV
jgi:hypothetical protein